MTAERDDDALLDMLIYARKTVRFVGDSTWQEFETNEILQQAVMRTVSMIGEAAGKVSATKKSAMREVLWEKIVGMRHRLTHDYRNINVALVWQVVREDLPALIPVLERVVPPDD